VKEGRVTLLLLPQFEALTKNRQHHSVVASPVVTQHVEKGTLMLALELRREMNVSVPHPTGEHFLAEVERGAAGVDHSSAGKGDEGEGEGLGGDDVIKDEEGEEDDDRPACVSEEALAAIAAARAPLSGSSLSVHLPVTEEQRAAAAAIFVTKRPWEEAEFDVAHRGYGGGVWAETHAEEEEVPLRQRPHNAAQVFEFLERTGGGGGV
jgi:hypothetical protein